MKEKPAEGERHGVVRNESERKVETKEKTRRARSRLAGSVKGRSKKG